MSIPQYQLYGETGSEPGDRYIHIEPISARAKPNAWDIKPHTHRDLHHLLLILNGRGQMIAEDRVREFTAPALIRVPACYVHGFRFAPDTEGWIVSASSSLLGRFGGAYPELETVYRQAIVLQLDAADELQRRLEDLALELATQRAGHQAAIESRLIGVQVTVLRLLSETSVELPERNVDSDLLMKFLRIVEQDFREKKTIADYVGQLHVCHEKLRQACSKLTGTTPLMHLNMRRLLEAKRELIHTNRSIAQIAESCGLQDPAYFSRFFAKHCGASPREYRESHRDSDSSAA